MVQRHLLIGKSFPKFDRGLRQLIHSELHWLDIIPERVKYKLGVITRRCLYGSAPSINLRVAFQSRRLLLDNIFVPLAAIS